MPPSINDLMAQFYGGGLNDSEYQVLLAAYNAGVDAGTLITSFASLPTAAAGQQLIADGLGGASFGSGGGVPSTFKTFNNESYQVLETDTYVEQIGTLSAIRAVTLPLADDCAIGHEVEIVERSGTATQAFYLSIVPSGADTILNPIHRNSITQVRIEGGLSSRRFRRATSTSWILLGIAPGRLPYFFFWHDRAIALPNSVFTPLPWGLAAISDTDGQHPGSTFSTTIAALSNGQVLPQGTINVASTVGAPTAPNELTIEGPPGASTDTVISYGAIGSSTTFTSCTLGTGTLATGQTVRAANSRVRFNTAGLYNMIADVAFACNATGGRRLACVQGPFRAAGVCIGGLAADTTPPGTVNDLTSQEANFAVQPGANVGDTMIWSAWQNSGGALILPREAINSPILMSCLLSEL